MTYTPRHSHRVRRLMWRQRLAQLSGIPGAYGESGVALHLHKCWALDITASHFRGWHQCRHCIDEED